MNNVASECNGFVSTYILVEEGHTKLFFKKILVFILNVVFTAFFVIDAQNLANIYQNRRLNSS